MLNFRIIIKTENQISDGSRQATVALEVVLSLVFVGIKPVLFKSDLMILFEGWLWWPPTWPGDTTVSGD